MWRVEMCWVEGVSKPARGRPMVTLGFLVLVAGGLSWAVLGERDHPGAPPREQVAAPHSSATQAPASSTATSTTTPLTRDAQFAMAPGTANRTCVDVDQLKAQGRSRPATNPDGTPALKPDGTQQYILDARSGDFVAGNFDELD